jgi:serine/threonine protein kinase
MAMAELSLPDSDDEIGDSLPAGTVLFHGQYRISRYINSGGFGITYLAKDSLDRDVVIKECFASTFCRRRRSRVSARSANGRENLQKLIRCFVKEAHSLSKLRHPNVVGVHRIFEENDTAYMTMDYIEGRDLLDVIGQAAPNLGTVEIAKILRKLVSALVYVHDAGLLHGDISPDNIFLDQNGEPIFIDFGACRKNSREPNAMFSGLSVVKDGYSPHELYFTGGEYGPWSDVYALGASMYHPVSRTPPSSSQRRVAAMAEGRPDPCLPLAGRFDGYPAGFLASIDKAMSPMPTARFRSAEEWMAVLIDGQDFGETNVKLIRKAMRLYERQSPDDRKLPPAPAAGRPQATSPLPPKDKEGTADLTELSDISGFIGGCLIDSETGRMMASHGGEDFDLEAASAANTTVVKAKLKAIDVLGLDDTIEDILITLGKQLHLIRPMEKMPTLFLYVALDKKAANLGMARVQAKKVEQSITL